jgi:hypothetical protein
MASKARDLSNFISVATIDASEIASNAVTTDKIADVAVTHAKLHTDMNLSGKTLTFATNQISGNVIDGGVISNFASTGIDDNSSSTAVTILSDGKVGIGITSPIRQLHLASSVPSIRLEDTDVSGAYNDIVHLSTGELSIRVDHGNVQSNSSLSFLIDADEKMRIDSSGNVGIGTTGPDAKLEVSNITANDLPFIISGGTSSLGSLPETTGMLFGYGSGAVYKKGAIIWEFTETNARGKLHFCNDSSADSANAQLSDSKMTIDSSGNVGIGTSSPSVGLEISGTGNASRLKLIDGSAQLNLGLWDGSNYRMEGDANRKILITSYHTDGVHIGNSGASNLVIKGGNVGIGNTAPEDYFAGAANLVIGSNNGTDNGITIVAPTNKLGRIHFADGTTGSAEYAGFIAYDHGTDELKFGAGADGGTDLTIKAGIVYAHQYNRGTPASSAPFGTIIFHDNQMSTANKSISNTQTSWSDGATKVVTPQSANSYFWVELYHNEHINTQTPNYGGGLRLIGDTGGVSTEVARGGEMIYVSNGAYAEGYNGNAKVWGGWYSPATASNITFRLQVTGTSSQSGNNYYWHWQSNYIANQPGPRLRIVEFT